MRRKRKKKSNLLLLLILAGVLIYFAAEYLDLWQAVTNMGGVAANGTGEITDVAADIAQEPAAPPEPAPAAIADPAKPADPRPAPPEADEPTRSHDELVQQLSFLQSPIPGAIVSTRDSHLPGAPRAYRNGIHEGLDYYSGACGVPVNFGDPVFAAGEGYILRIDHAFSELAVAQRNEMLQQAIAAGEMPAEVLDRLRGRQVWIEHADGVVTRYAHLHEVSEQLQVGDRVETGTLIGTVGNSGTSDGALGNQDGAHLHFEIRLGESYLGEGMDPAAVRLLLQKILGNGPVEQ